MSPTPCAKVVGKKQMEKLLTLKGEVLHRLPSPTRRSWSPTSPEASRTPLRAQATAAKIWDPSKPLRYAFNQPPRHHQHLGNLDEAPLLPRVPDRPDADRLTTINKYLREARRRGHPIPAAGHQREPAQVHHLGEGIRYGLDTVRGWGGGLPVH